MLFSASVSQSPLKPTLEEFDEVLALLARELHDDSDPQRDAWIRGSFSAAGVKLDALGFILKHGASRSSPALLDIGAQIGSLTMYAARFGIRSSAVDLPYFFERFASASLKSGIDYRSCDVSTDPLPFAEEAFDYVTYLDVIEHHPHSPKRVLEEIHRVLKPGGCIIVSTPNQASLYNRLTLLAGGSISDPFHYFFETAAQMTPYPGHHREYVRSELRSALADSGFRVLECRVMDDDVRPALSLAGRDANANPLRKLWRHRMSIGPAALGHVWSFLRLPFGRVLWAVGEKAEPSA